MHQFHNLSNERSALATSSLEMDLKLSWPTSICINSVSAATFELFRVLQISISVCFTNWVKGRSKII